MVGCRPRLSQNVVCWEELAPFWGLTEAEEEEINSVVLVNYNYD